MTISEYETRKLKAIESISLCLKILSTVVILHLMTVILPVVISLALTFALAADPLDCIEKEHCKAFDKLILQL